MTGALNWKTLLATFGAAAAGGALDYAARSATNGAGWSEVLHSAAAGALVALALLFRSPLNPASPLPPPQEPPKDPPR